MAREKKNKMPASSTLVLGVASVVTLLGGLLALLMPSASVASFVLVAVGVGLAWAQWAVGNREHRQELEQEREHANLKMQNAVINSDRLRLESVLSSYSRGKAQLESQQPKEDKP